MESCPFESFFMTNEYDGMSDSQDKTYGWMLTELEFFLRHTKKE